MAQSSPNKNRLLEKYVQVVREDGLQTNKNVNIGINGNTSNLWVGGNITAGGTMGSTGGQPQTGSVQSTVWHTGGTQPFGALTTNYSQTQFSSTTSYYAEVFIPDNTLVTGISVLNGHTTSASQNTFVGLANAGGTIVASSNTTTAQGTADAYQQIPFTAPYNAVGPSKYFIVVQGSNTTGYLGTHTKGNFSASTQTSETYGTFLTTATYKTTTFTTAVGPVADTY